MDTNYYQYKCDSDKFESIKLADSTAYEELKIFDGRSLLDTWSPLKIIIYKNKIKGNFFMLSSHIPVVDETAMEVLKPLIKDTVEYLPLSHDDRATSKLYAVNVLPVIDCLDLKKSDINFYEDGRPMHDWEAVFINNIINNNIFKIKDLS